MNEESQEILFDLLTKQAIYGLDASEHKQLDHLSASNNYYTDDSFELTAAAIGISGIEADEQMPAHLYSKILASADSFYDKARTTQAVRTPAEAVGSDEMQPTFEFEPKKASWLGWAGWLVASVACIALAVNIFTTRSQKPVDIAANPSPTPIASPDKPSPAKQFEEILASANVIKASFGPVPKGPVELASAGGDVVWNDAKQTGYMKLHGLPKNDKSVSTYQLWIFDENQDAKYPIDGGTFDINEDGDVIIPIDAKIATKNPKMFAITVEKPGGVVVSDRKKMAALAQVVKIET